MVTIREYISRFLKASNTGHKDFSVVFLRKVLVLLWAENLIAFYGHNIIRNFLASKDLYNTFFVRRYVVQ